MQRSTYSSGLENFHVIHAFYVLPPPESEQSHTMPILVFWLIRQQ